MPNIPAYPHFIQLTIDLVNNFSPYQNWQRVCSDFSFSNLFAWDVNSTATISELNQNLVVILPDYNNSKDFICTIIGDNKLSDTLSIILNDKVATSVTLLPEQAVKALSNTQNSYLIIEDRNSFDYLYNLDHLTKLEGPEYKHIRRGLSNFASKNIANFQYIHQATPDAFMKASIISLIEAWGEAKYQNKDYEEGRAIKRAIEHFERLPINLAVVMSGSRPAGFIIYENMHDGIQAIVHFEKATDKYPHLSYFLKHSFHMGLKEQGFSVMNYEQDLGIEGLRQTKLVLNPSGFNKKFIVSKR